MLPPHLSIVERLGEFYCSFAFMIIRNRTTNIQASFGVPVFMLCNMFAKNNTENVCIKQSKRLPLSITTDACTSHNDFKLLFGEHRSQVIDPKDIGKVLPWVQSPLPTPRRCLPICTTASSRSSCKST